MSKYIHVEDENENMSNVWITDLIFKELECNSKNGSVFGKYHPYYEFEGQNFKLMEVALFYMIWINS